MMGMASFESDYRCGCRQQALCMGHGPAPVDGGQASGTGPAVQHRHKTFEAQGGCAMRRGRLKKKPAALARRGLLVGMRRAYFGSVFQ